LIENPVKTPLPPLLALALTDFFASQPMKKIKTAKTARDLKIVFTGTA